MKEAVSPTLASTGLAGLDDILCGGLVTGKLHLLSGQPGTGKTTFALHFIADGLRRGERCLLITVGNIEDDFRALAHAGGISLPPELFYLYRVDISGEILAGPENRVFSPEESEPVEELKMMLAEIERVQPSRVVVDSLSDLRQVVEEVINFRRLILALRRLFDQGKTTVLLVNNTDPRHESAIHLETMCHTVIHLEQVALVYGPARRRLMVRKVRGRDYRTGWHDFRIVTGGIRVFPTLVAGEYLPFLEDRLVSSGNAELDRLFGGGVDQGSTLAIVGASGTGKTTVATQYVAAAAEQGGYVLVCLFDETQEAYRKRTQGLGLVLDGYLEQGLVTLWQVDVAEFSVGEFTAELRQQVEERGVRTLVIDTLSGYANAMRNEEYLIPQLHELFSYLSHQGVTTIITVVQHGLFAEGAPEMQDVSYLAESLLLLRFFESRGEIRRAISVVKRRRGPHETTIRELRFSGNGIVLGEPLSELRGVLTGVPTLER